MSYVTKILEKKSFNSGVVIPTKMRFCNECSKEKCCDGCNNQINETNEFEASLYLLKREAPNDFGYILPFYKLL